jgi:hypothetical protein
MINLDTIIHSLPYFLDPLSSSLKSLREFPKNFCKVLESSQNILEISKGFARKSMLVLIAREWPEIHALILKLLTNKELSDIDRAWLMEVANEVGWDEGEVVEELKSAIVDPSVKTGKYKELFEKYYQEAFKLFDKDTRQAGEKIWGAVTALIKLHAAKRGVPIIHWDHGKLYSYVNNNVEKEYRDLFNILLLKAERLHRHFYEDDLDANTFKEFFNDVVRLIENVKKLISLYYLRES